MKWPLMDRYRGILFMDKTPVAIWSVLGDRSRPVFILFF